MFGPAGRFLNLAAVSLGVAVACTGPLTSDVPAFVPPPSATESTIEASTAAPPSPTPTIAPQDLAQVKRLLQDSARRRGVNPNLVMGIAWWESGWDQSKVSVTGAVGIMQVEPATAESAGPLLLHRRAAITDPADNVELGTAILKEDLDRYNNDVAKALVAYYAGPAAVTDWVGQDAEAKRYVMGVYRLALAFSQGAGPA